MGTRSTGQGGGRQRTARARTTPAAARPGGARGDAELAAVFRSLHQVQDALALEMFAETQRSVPAYRDVPAERRQRFLEHARDHIAAISLLGDQPVPDLGFVRERAAGLALQGGQLCDLLMAYRVGHSSTWARLASAAADVGSRRRDGAARLAMRVATLTMQYTDAITRAAEEAYQGAMQRLRHDQFLARSKLFVDLVEAPRSLDEHACVALESLGIGRSATLRVLVARPASGSRAAAGPVLLEALARHLGMAGQALDAGSTRGALFVLLPAGTRLEPELLEGAAAQADIQALGYRVALSEPVRGWTHVGLAFRQALRAARVARQPVTVADSRSMSRLLDLMAAEDVLPEVPFLVQRLSELEPPLLRTLDASLSALADASLNGAEAARRLGIHANTLVYRLQRLREATGLEPNHYGDSLRLLLAFRSLRTAGDQSGP